MTFWSVPPQEIQISRQGRLVIPIEMRRQLDLQPGEVLISRIEEGRLVLEKRDNVLRRLRQRFAKVPEGVSLAEELIAERRQEAAAEVADRPARGDDR